MVLESWKSLSEETICKSFFCVGQAKTSRVEDITCLSNGAPAAAAREAVSEIWDKIPVNLELLPEEIDLNEDKFNEDDIPDISDED